MSESVQLISSHAIELEELHSAILSAGGKTEVLVDEKGYGQLGAVIDGKRRILISGYRHPSDDPSFWERQLPYFGQGMLEEIQKKLGARPIRSFFVEVGHAYRSGLLAVEFAYRCAERWPCVVLADITVNRKPESKIYAREEILNLHVEGKAFSTYGMLEEDFDDDDE